MEDIILLNKIRTVEIEIDHILELKQKDYWDKSDLSLLSVFLNSEYESRLYKKLDGLGIKKENLSNELQQIIEIQQSTYVGKKLNMFNLDFY